MIYLIRFTQADTIVPAGVQGYDRYAFVNNNPVRYTDLSGHKACWATAQYTCITNNHDPEEITSDCEGLTGQCYDGKGMKRLYEYYVGHKGWWNNYGKISFSVGRFLSMMMCETSTALGGRDWTIKAATLQIWGDSSAVGGHVPYCTTVCENGIFNFLAAYVESAQKRYDLLIQHVDPITRKEKNNYALEMTWPFLNDNYTEEKSMMYYYAASNYIASQIFNPNLADEIYTNDKPYHWGSYSKVGSEGAFYSFDSFYVFNITQHNSATAAGGSLIQK